jgi:hypothetical protein
MEEDVNNMLDNTNFNSPLGDGVNMQNKANLVPLQGLGVIEIMDTTLRDGEQTTGVSFAGQEKLIIARLLLEDLGVDRIEIASARISEGEFKSGKKVAEWARDMVIYVK